MASDLCFGCKTYQEIVYTESDTNRPYCENCALSQLPTSDELALLLLTAPWSPFCAPFKPGDKVEARTVGKIYDGVGEITDISVSLEHGATPVFPTFRVVFTEKAHDDLPNEVWYPEICLTKVSE